MAKHHSDQLSDNFYAWETRGRGWWVYTEPIYPEPPFRPFPGHVLQSVAPKDDTFRHSIATYLGDAIKKRFGRKNDQLTELEEIEEPGAHIFPFEAEIQMVELQIAIPSDLKLSPAIMEQFLVMIGNTQSPLSFEIIGTHEEIVFQLVCRTGDARHVGSQIRAFFPQFVVKQSQRYLYDCLAREECQNTTLEFGLKEEFMRPLHMTTRLDVDMYTAIIGILHELEPHQVGVIQILFHGTIYPWADSIMRSVTTTKGESFFADAPEMTTLAREKVSQPLFAVNLRILTQSRDQSATTVALNLAAALMVGTENVGVNVLHPLDRGEISQENFLASIIFRMTYRSGMILNARELLTFVHFASDLPSDKLVSFRKSKLAPAEVRQDEYLLGYNEHNGQKYPVGLPIETRLRHIHMVGATGMGKSTLIINLILQNILNESAGGVVLDPHGDLINDIVAQIPESLQHKYIIIDPSDQQYSIGFNLLSANNEHEKIMLASDLAAIFRLQATSWGDQMDAVLQNAIAAFLDSPKGGSLLDLRRFLIDAAFRKQYLKSVRDPLIVSYWQNEFTKLRGGSLTSLLSRMQSFLRPKPVRYMLMQERGLDFSMVMDDGLTVLIKLSQGLIGKENSHLLGSIILTKLYQTALGRQIQAKAERKPFFVYIDEFQHFITPTLEGILSGARKYGLGLVLAHQGMDQLLRRSPAVASSVIANAGTRISFRVGEDDAARLQNSFAEFDAYDLATLDIGDALVRVGRRDQDFNLTTLLPPAVPGDIARKRYLSVLYKSSLTFGVLIRDLEDKLNTEYGRPPSGNTSVFETIEHEDVIVPDVPEPEVAPEALPLELPPVTPPKSEEIADFERAKEEFLESEKKRIEETEHQMLQAYIKSFGEGMGYRSTIEAKTPDGKGRVDVLLENDRQTIACEVAVTTSNKHELGNIRKCLKAGYTLVVVVSEKPKRLENIRTLVTKEISETDQKRIHFINKEGFAALIETQMIEVKSEVKTHKGRRVVSRPSMLKGKDAKDFDAKLTEIYMRSKKNKGKKK